MGFQSLKLKLIIDFDLIVTFIRLYIATSVQIMPRHRSPSTEEIDSSNRGGRAAAPPM
jgi:hypothetical protein